MWCASQSRAIFRRCALFSATFAAQQSNVRATSLAKTGPLFLPLTMTITISDAWCGVVEVEVWCRFLPGYGFNLLAFRPALPRPPHLSTTPLASVEVSKPKGSLRTAFKTKASLQKRSASSFRVARALKLLRNKTFAKGIVERITGEGIPPPLVGLACFPPVRVTRRGTRHGKWEGFAIEEGRRMYGSARARWPFFFPALPAVFTTTFTRALRAFNSAITVDSAITVATLPAIFSRYEAAQEDRGQAAVQHNAAERVELCAKCLLRCRLRKDPRRDQVKQAERREEDGRDGAGSDQGEK